jgi:UDP-N-acetylglucosamine transferase subunit ALG13
MVGAIDQWAETRGRCDVFAQVGPTKYEPKHIRWSQFIDAQEFRQRVAEADLVVAHAGMGSILTALEMGKPIMVMPRLAGLKEHRNDHQMATAKRFLAQGRILVAFDETHLIEKLDQIGDFRATERISAKASPRLLAAIRSFILTGTVPSTDAPAVGLEAAGVDLPPVADGAETRSG